MFLIKSIQWTFSQVVRPTYYASRHIRCREARYNPSVRPMPSGGKNGAAYWAYGYYGTLVGRPMLEIEPTGQRGAWPYDDHRK